MSREISSITNHEKYDLLSIYFRNGENEQRSVVQWRVQFPNRPIITRYTIRAIVYNLREWGTLDTPRHSQGRGQSGLPVNVQEAVLEYFNRQPRASTRQAGRFGDYYVTRRCTLFILEEFKAICLPTMP